MVNVILVFDDYDFGTDEIPGLDYFFKECAIDIRKNLQADKFKIIEINGEVLNLEKINKSIDEFEDKRFIFIAYSHGSEYALLYSNQEKEYVSNSNISKFSNSFVYTWSCFAGKELGIELIRNNCSVFIGYDKQVIAGTMDTNLFVDAANSGIIKFISGCSIMESYYFMKDKYTQIIDYFDNEKNDYVVASFFRKNRDALLFLGEDISISEFMFEN